VSSEAEVIQKQDGRSKDDTLSKPISKTKKKMLKLQNDAKSQNETDAVSTVVMPESMVVSPDCSGRADILQNNLILS
jgi:hypothetical protein